MDRRSIPNILTIGRLMLCPVFLVLAAQPVESLRWTAWVLLIVALCTDVVDGQLARRYGWVSKFGIFLDPAVDKIVHLAAFFQMVSWGYVPLWVPLVMMGRELVVDSVRSGAAMEGKLVPANWMGKTKALCMSITVGTAFWVRAYFTIPGSPWEKYWLDGVLWMSCGTAAISVILGLMFLNVHRNLFIDRSENKIT
jgi:CDP-diacylglycerol--glycerol-3-phosphate 3-phosphatidyltransferase